MKSALILAAFLALPTYAHEFICSTGGHRLHADAGSNFDLAAAPKGRAKIARFDLEQAYSGQPILLGNTWLMVYTLPANAPLARDALFDLGVSPGAAERMAKSTGLIDRGIRLVKSEDEMIEKVANSHPAAGYLPYVPKGSNVRPCF